LLAGQGDVPVTLDAYRQQTVRLRNDVEFRAFEAQVDEVTEWVGSESAAQLEAFHRMVDENADAEFIRERAGAAEAMNEAAREEQRQWATRRTFQLLWLLGPIMSRAFR
jgi:phosphodiesterase/alkaline phosphatase D-like protein